MVWLWRQQGPQAGVHRPRRARDRRRHSRLDRRIQSNHTRQVAAVAAHLGLKARLVQEKWVPWDDPVNDKVGNILLSRMMGADSGWTRPVSTSASATSWEDAIARGRGGRRQAVPDPGRRERAPPRWTGLRELGLRGRRAGEGARRPLRHHRRVHRHGLDARRHDRRLRCPGGLTGVRRRVVGIDASATLAKTTRPGATDRPAHCRADRTGSRSAR